MQAKPAIFLIEQANQSAISYRTGQTGSYFLQKMQTRQLFPIEQAKQAASSYRTGKAR